MPPVMAILTQSNNIIGVKPPMPISVDRNNVVTFLAWSYNAAIKTVLAQWPLFANVLAHALPSTVVTFLLGCLAFRLLASTALAFDYLATSSAKSRTHYASLFAAALTNKSPCE